MMKTAIKVVAVGLCVFVLIINLLIIHHSSDDDGKNDAHPKSLINLNEQQKQPGEAVQIQSELQKAEPDNVNRSNQAEVTDVVYFDMQIAGKDVGRITIGLFGKVVPRTVANFRGVAEGFIDPDTGDKLSFKGNKFHRTIKDFVLQGGDINGRGGASIYGGTFEDENFDLKFYGAGWVAMASAGPNTMKSQFFIAGKTLGFLDGKSVVFGKVLKGMKIVRMMEDVPTEKESPTPGNEIIIAECGTIPGPSFWTDKAASPEIDE